MTCSEPCHSITIMRMLPATCSLIILFTACGGKPFDVKPRVDLPAPGPMARARLGDLTVQAAAITDEDLLCDTFDANLVQAGVLPVKIKITNEGEQPLNLDKARVELRGESEREFRILDSQRAFKRLVSYYEISTYNKYGYRRSLEDFESYQLDLRTPLLPGETRHGVIFFAVGARAVNRAGLMLVIDRLSFPHAKKDSAVRLILN